MGEEKKKKNEFYIHSIIKKKKNPLNNNVRVEFLSFKQSLKHLVLKKKH